MSAHTPHELHEEFPHDARLLHLLKLADAHFCNLAARYHALNRSIHRIEAEVECASDMYLTRLRKQRLMLLDEIAAIIEEAEERLSKGGMICGPPIPAPRRLFGVREELPA
jgi:uncharacterized protein YdcH (DUF465 family)